ncbi:MAG: hypothetical protein JNK93_19075 [Planctomycetia bacterium]|nr:hypothetical protein [Planctomycetia bacterium]
MARGKRGEGPNKMQLVRDAIAALGPKAKPKEIQAKVQELGGIVMGTGMISSYKSLLSKPKKGKGRKPGRPAKDASAPSAVAKTGANIADDIVLIRKLIGRLGAKQVSDLVDVLK